MRLLLTTLLIPTLLASCARNDYYGIDPQTYNEVLYPKTNTVKQNSIYHSFYFAEAAPTFDGTTIHHMDNFLSYTYPSAVSRLILTFGDRDQARELYVTRLLRARGFKKSIMQYRVDPTMHPDEMIIAMDYSYVEPPRCPDWRKSSNLNYSNTNHSNMYCATATNFGKQVANPQDLKHSASSTRIMPDPYLDVSAIESYRSGEVNQATAETNASGD